MAINAEPHDSNSPKSSLALSGLRVLVYALVAKTPSRRLREGNILKGSTMRWYRDAP